MPYLLLLLFGIGNGKVADMLIDRKPFGLTLTMTRKIMNTVGHWGPALAILGLAFTGCNPTMSVVWLCIAVMLNGAAISGFQVVTVHVSDIDNHGITLFFIQ